MPMRKMVLTGLRAMALCEAPDPRISKDTDVLLKVGRVGVCGSDVHYYNAGRIGSQVVQYPFAAGHEFSATVAAAGAAVRRVKPGDRVAVDPAMPCGQCDQCRAHRAHTCRTLRFLGCPGQAEGCLAEYIVMPEGCCFPIRPGTTLEQAAFVEPLSIGLYAAMLAGSLTGARIGILGCGPIGLSVLLAARTRGVARIYATDKIAARLAAAGRAGAGWTGNPDTQDVVADIAAAEPLLLDAVFECCGEQAAVDQAVRLLKPGGCLVVVGIPMVERIAFDMDQLRRKEIRIQNVRRQNECTRAALDLIEAGSLRVDPLITHRFPFAQTPAAFELVESYRDGVVKAMIEVG
jgi:L-iditol 2-dehydrogenase